MLRFRGLNCLLEKSLSFRPCLLNYVTKVEVPESFSSHKQDVKQFAPATRRKGELKPFKQDFLTCLFTGAFDENIMIYPTVLTSTDILHLLKHASKVESFLNTFEDSMDISKGSPASVLAKMKETGLFGLTVPQEYGGLQYTETHKQFLIENLKFNHNIIQLVANQENFCTKILMSLGSEDQKLKYLPKLASGDLLGSAAFLENTPLLDLVSYATTSVIYNNKTILLNGSKVCVTNADIADFFLVFSQFVQSSNVNDRNTYHFCIVDKNTPGVGIEQTTNNDIHFPVYKVNFENVEVPIENSLGGIDQSVFGVLKTTLTSNQLSASAVCLATLKSLLNSAILHCHEKSNLPLTKYSILQHNIAYLSMYTYVIESLVYLVAGRVDEFDKPDLFLESCAAKALAVDYLRLGIEKYMEVVGNTCYLLSSPFQEALRVLHYYSYLDESNSNLKVIIASRGTVASAHTDIEMRRTAELMRVTNILSIKDILKSFWSDKRKFKMYKNIFNYKGEIITDLVHEAEVLGECFAFFRLSLEKHLARFGSESANIECNLYTFGDLAANLFGLIACLSRATSSFLMFQENAEDEINLTKLFGFYIKSISERVYHDIKFDINAPVRYRGIGKRTFNYKQYPPHHPLTRGY